MSRVEPRQVVHDGRLRVDALLIEPALVGETAARKRCLAYACEGASVDAVADAYLVDFTQARARHSVDCDGTPLVRTLLAARERLCAAPLTTDERAALETSPPASGIHEATLVLVRGGAVVCLGDPTPVDLSTWLDVSGFTLAIGRGLGPEPVGIPPKLAGDEAPTDVRTILGAAIPAPDPKLERLLSALAANTDTDPARARRPAALGVPAPPQTGFWGWLGRLWRPAARPALNPSRLPPGSDKGRVQLPDPDADSPRSQAPVARPLLDWLRSTLFADDIGRRQAQYIHRTKQLFERGDWREALRAAIPLTGEPGQGDPMLSVPTPREDLALGGPTSAAHSLGFDPDLFAAFKTLYSEAAEALEAEGRIEEAAYVWFELLGDDTEGIALLERHRRWALAAAMAARRKMDPSLIIRLWFLAGDPGRAVLLARRTGTFAAACERLQASNPEFAARLRLLWADWLASGGDYATAVDVVWPLAEARHIARAWIDRAVAFGGPVGATMLIRKLVVFGREPATLEAVSKAILEACQSTLPAAPGRRRELLSALHCLPRDAPEQARAQARALLALVARRVVVDGGGLDPALDKSLPSLGLLLRQDMRDAPRGPASGLVQTSIHARTFAAHERGLTPVHDALFLANGRVLVALGEAGVRLLDADGRILRRDVQPTTHLVATPETTRALCAHRRGRSWTLRHVDLVTGKTTAWCRAEYLHNLQFYDGRRWFVAQADALAWVDTQAASFEALWRVGQLPGSVRALAGDQTWVCALLSLADPVSPDPRERRRSPRGVEIWRYEHATQGPVLRTRTPRALDLGPRTDIVLRPDGAVLCATPFESATSDSALGPGTRLHTFDAGGTETRNTLETRARPVSIAHDRFGLLIPTHRGLELCPIQGATPLDPILTLEGARSATVRPHAGGFTICDDLGRVARVRGHVIERLVYVR